MKTLMVHSDPPTQIVTQKSIRVNHLKYRVVMNKLM